MKIAILFGSTINVKMGTSLPPLIAQSHLGPVYLSSFTSAQLINYFALIYISDAL